MTAKFMVSLRNSKENTRLVFQWKGSLFPALSHVKGELINSEGLDLLQGCKPGLYYTAVEHALPGAMRLIVCSFR